LKKGEYTNILTNGCILLPQEKDLRSKANDFFFVFIRCFIYVMESEVSCFADYLFSWVEFGYQKPPKGGV